MVVAVDFLETALNECTDTSVLRPNVGKSQVNQIVYVGKASMPDLQKILYPDYKYPVFYQDGEIVQQACGFQLASDITFISTPERYATTYVENYLII